MKRITVYLKDVHTVVTNRRLSVGQRFLRWFMYSRFSFLLFLDGRLFTVRKVRMYGNTVSVISMTEFFMLFREIYVREVYYFSHSDTKPVIIDCGSNIGLTVLYFKHLYPDAKIVAFEPAPNVFAVLKQNVEQNHLKDVEVHQVALGAEQKTITLYVREHMTLATTVAGVEANEGTEVQVQQVLLSNFVEGHVDLLKIDVQLAEGGIIQDLAQKSKLEHVHAINMEYHYHAGYEDNSLAAILRVFEARNLYYLLQLNAVKPDGFATYTVNVYSNGYENR